MITNQDMQTYLLDKISLAPSMQIEVQELSSDVALLGAPLIANYNHMGTAFGGSLVNLSLMAGYSLVYGNMQRDAIEAHLVIAKQEMRFLAPVEGDFEAKARFSAGVEWEKSSQIFVERGRCRLPIEIVVTSNTAKVGEMLADFALVAIDH